MAGVYILTTEGPVLIQSIAEEEPTIRSVICVDGTAESLPISVAYDAFVRRPTGVIERLTGHGAYRMDIAARIDEGRSWQLSAFIAHVAHAQDRQLPVVLASGEVDSGGAVRPVAHVDRKLAALRASGLADASPGAVVLLPPGACAKMDVSDLTAAFTVREVASVEEALSILGLKMPSPAKLRSNGDAAPIRWRPLRFAVGVVLLAALVFWFGVDLARWSALAENGRLLELEAELDTAQDSHIGKVRAAIFEGVVALLRPDADDLRLDGALTVADAADSCATNAQTRLPLSEALPGNATVCAIEMRAFAQGGGTVPVGRLAYWPTGLGDGSRAARIMRGSAEKTGRAWHLDFEQKPQTGAVVRLVVIAGPVEVTGSQPWYGDLLENPSGGATFDAQRSRLHRLGYTVLYRDWQRR